MSKIRAKLERQVAEHKRGDGRRIRKENTRTPERDAAEAAAREQSEKRRAAFKGNASHDVVYGLMVPKGQPMLPIELQCYRQDRKESEGGLGKLRHFKNAWNLLWPDFQWNDWARIICEAWVMYSRISIMGHGAAGKTYNMAFCAYLDWLADPFSTMTSLTTVTADGLRLRMWGDLMRAHEAGRPEVKRMLKVYSTSNRMNVMFDVEAAGGAKSHEFDKYIIEGMATSRTADASGRIRGKHAPRKRLILDEADDMPDVIYETFANVRTDPDVKIVDMSNAVDRYSNFGKACEPEAGWHSIHDTDLFWRTRGGGICIHLDGLQNPNMKAGLDKNGQKKYHFMLGPKEVEEIKREHGEDSAQWWSYVRGFFPPDGIVSKVWPSAAIEAAKKQIEFDFKPEPCATLDPAFSYDECVLHVGNIGKLRDGRRAIQAAKSFKINTKQTASEPEDYQIAHEVMRICKEAGVEPKNYIQDKTGNGRGVYAVLQKEWSPDVGGINYSGEATERPLRVGQMDKANEWVKYFVSELWFRASYLAYDGLIGGLGNLHPKTLEDLNSRRYETVQTSKGKRMVVESKDQMRKRLGRSPDNGDAFSQFGELLARELALTGKKDTQTPVSQKWIQQRERAVAASQRYAESSTYSSEW